MLQGGNALSYGLDALATQAELPSAKIRKSAQRAACHPHLFAFYPVISLCYRSMGLWNRR
ncbi:MAG: hypothetical protein AL399_05470 [Candidatus [Bacteroides] periocalifornicus]|uniref:Uncharacterized protein n=1 Tax=Candidatus [Bacteroides] periocalifornicus TaxID=1702214 RepID=A0A0Q4B6X4_9BACT|nr:MAG: hypothetical protein AL399_05470 [Candidatus [Bacteroides] periocalifornicus]